MNEHKSRWRKEFETLPDWAQKMVMAVSGGGLVCYGYGNQKRIPLLSSNTGIGFFAEFKDDRIKGWSEGFKGLRDFAHALSAPHPPPIPIPHEKITTENLVEILASGEGGCAFDQPCHFGHRVDDHAVYCHNDAWPDAPRKCRRNRGDYRHEDCPGFVPNVTSP